MYMKSLILRKSNSIGYPHDGLADNAGYWHDRCADKRRYRHDRRADSLSLETKVYRFIITKFCNFQLYVAFFENL